MSKEMLINVSEGEECRIALLEDGKLEELYMERTSSTSHVGNIYKGKVTNVEASIQAAFVDFGLGRNGFLHISDLMPTYFGRAGEDIVETVGKKMSRRDRPPIQRCLRRGDEIVVQIIKEGIGTKGPTLSTYLSIPGRILVMMPGMGKMGVSRKIEDDTERRRLRQILDGLKPPRDVGFIIRTAGVGKSKLEIERDLKYLTRLWENLVKRRDGGPGPMELYTEGDLVARTVRDVFTADVDRIIVDNEEVGERVKDVIKLSSPRTRNKVEVYDEPIPLFHKFGIEREIELMYSRHVPLPSGGSLVIDSTEAIVAIDVNSGKFRDHSDAETTAFKTDLEAADEIARQLRLRDLGGVIICDFIDLRYERHRVELEERLSNHLKNDRAKTKMLRMSQFGIIEMTRQRMRPSYKRAVYFDCPHCKGAGLVKTPESMGLDVMRRLAMAINDQKVVRAELSVCADVAFYLQNKKRRALAELEERSGKRIVINSDPKLALDEMKLSLFDMRDGLVMLEHLESQPALPHRTQLATRPYPPRDAGRGQGGRDSRRQSASESRRPPRGDEFEEERIDFDRDEDEGEHESPAHSEDDRGRQRDERPRRDQRDERGPRPEGRQQRDDSRQHRDDSRQGRDGSRGQRDDVRGQRDDSRRQQGGGRYPQEQQRGRQNQGGGRPGQGGPQQPRRDDRDMQRGNVRPSGPVVAGESFGDEEDHAHDDINGNLPAGASNGGDQDNFGEDRPRRRRRRRGRRGRGRGGQGNQGQGRDGYDNRSNIGAAPRSAGPSSYESEYEVDDGPPQNTGQYEDSDEPDHGHHDVHEESHDVAPHADDRGTERSAAESSEVADVSEETGAAAEQAEAAEGDGPRRRRRRRGGRGRGRRGAANEAPAESERAEAEPSAEVPAESTPPPAEEPAPAKRPARGTRARKPRETKAARIAREAAEAEAGKAPAPEEKPARAARARIATPEDVASTRSADKHLAEDEPVAQEPVRRPRSYRDLDELPDDFD